MDQGRSGSGNQGGRSLPRGTPDQNRNPGISRLPQTLPGKRSSRPSEEKVRDANARVICDTQTSTFGCMPSEMQNVSFP